MNPCGLLTASLLRARQVLLGVAGTLAISWLTPAALAGPVTLGTAADFSLLAGAAITSTGATVVDHGHIGVAPGATLTGFPPGVLTAPFTFKLGDATAQQAQTDLASAYNAAAALAPTLDLTGQDLGGRTLAPGVYFFAASAQLTGTLTLNHGGDPNALFVFQVGSTLDTAAGGAVVSINNPRAPGLGVYWQVGSAATFGPATTFEGDILAMTSITAGAGAAVEGRLLARNGTILLNENRVAPPLAGSAVPDAANPLLLLGAGMALTGLLGRMWRRA